MTEKELLNWVQQDKSDEKPKRVKYSEEDIVTPQTFEGLKNVVILTNANGFTIDFANCTQEDFNEWYIPPDNNFPIGSRMRLK